MTALFEILANVPAALNAAGLMTAATRAGATGVLDLHYCPDDLALAAFQRLRDARLSTLALRISAGQHALLAKLLAQAGDCTLTVIVSDDVTGEAMQTALARTNTRVFAEITAVEQLKHLPARVAGIVARGHEAGGWVGEESSFILLQKLVGKTTLPVYVQGGIGVHSAAACRVAKAAGVILDDALLLLAESPLSTEHKAELSRLNGSECRLAGELIQHPFRFYARPGSAPLKAIEEFSRQAEAGELAVGAWKARIEAAISWTGTATLLPLGQSIGLAAQYASRYGTVAKLVQAVKRASLQDIELAAARRSLDEGGALALSHGTRYPLAQGPMTRVTDHAGFAAAVAEGGALPFLALALMRGPAVAEMLEATRALVGDKPWGVGMLGFVPQALREEQCAEIWKCKPPFALIAGGRPDQAAEFEKRGIATYIHAPAPALLKMYLEQGSRRFVFEGRECGGHIGPLVSFVLWEHMIEVLLAEVKPGEENQIHVLFAGGVHDALSAAMLAAMTAPLSARGMKVGALMGTAYLFTEEIVSTGAVVEGFQTEALNCQRTMNLESGPGHSTRCVDTQFAHDFYAERRRLIREGKNAEEIRDLLEDLNLGRLRIASKGVNRDASGAMVTVAAAQQFSDGMYMIGQAATLRDRTLSITALHNEVCHGAQRRLEQAAQGAAKQKAVPSDVAIVGIGVVLPKANNAGEYWHNILHKVSVIREVPESRWDWKMFFDENPKTRDKIYSRWGGFLDEISFDPMRFGIPPRSMKSIDPMQILTLETASRALADAGYAHGGFDRENTSVVLGAGGGSGELGLQYAMRAELPRFVENPSDLVWDRLPEWTEESFAGTLLNVAAGRVANRLDFGGINFTVDAACASSLAAISIAVNELETGRSSMVLAGGFDTTQSAFAFTAFAKTQALSISGQPRTFDQAADGIAISEGVAMVVLKRLADAERDGDRIYAVIKAAAGSSDGKALGLTAPRSEGQVRALDRAYAKAGFSPATLGLVEAHGTGTPVGDRAEAQTICRALTQQNAAPKSVALGSVKTLLGHTKASAGVSGMIKVALALHHRVLPAHAGVENPIDSIADPQSPVYLLKEPRPWVRHPDHPRRGGASAFGFGGTNFHVVVEEYARQTAAAGSQRWPHELCLFRTADAASLAKELEALIPQLQTGSRVPLSELAFALAAKAEGRGLQPVSLAVISADLAALARDLKAVVEHLRGNGKPLPPTVRYGAATPSRAPAVAYLFPGQGSQYLNMGRETALYFDEVREALELADEVLRGDFAVPLSSLMLPPAAFDEGSEAAQSRALTDTRTAQPAIGTVALGYLRLAQRLGCTATASAGHSYGEYAALMAAGVITPEDFLRLSAVRGKAMAEASKTAVAGGMAAVQGHRENILALIAECAGVSIANHNSPEQSVISGPKAAVEQAAQKLSDAGLRATLLPVSGAFHTELVAPAKALLTSAINATAFSAARHPVYSNGVAKPYPAAPAAMKKLLAAHLLGSVEFVAEIEAMYAAGSRVFVELGPKGTCSNMARQTLAGRDALCVSLDGNGGGLRGLLLGLADLYTAGVAWQPTALFARRELPALDLAQLAALAHPLVLPKHTWMVSGGCARPINDPVIRTGTLVALTQAGAEAARAVLATVPAASPVMMQPVMLPVTAPQVPVPISAGSAPVPAMSGALSSEALVAYQQTMRQFLALQERVVQQFMGGGGTMAAAAMAMPMAVPAPQSPAVPAIALAPAIPAVAAIAAPAAAPVAAAPAPVRTVDYTAILLDIVAERTGYPAEMLGLDADLEADLGIDSIKRVEILGAFQKAMPAAIGSQVQGHMERFTKAKSLNAILAAVQSLAGSAAHATVPAAAPSFTPAATVQAPMPAAAAAVAVDYQSVLLGIVADRTGYPAEMLGLDADLEADLGIDSIKRVEILGAFQKTLPAEIGGQVQGRMERFTKAKSLNTILAEVQALAGSATQATVPAAAPSFTPAATVQAPMPVAAATTVAVDFRSLLLGIVAERTGYPAEMLGLDADLEADLGIDSIKRVEILGAFQKALSTDIASQVHGAMERFTKAKTLNSILRETQLLSGNVEQEAAVKAALAASVVVTLPLTAGATVADYKSLLLDVVADRTGYPVEMLGVDADLEADLGIDSIKRVEILGAFQKLLPAHTASLVQGAMERFTKAKTLAAVLAAVQSLAAPVVAATAAAAPAVTAPPPATPAVAQAAAVVEALPRFAIKSRSAPLSGQTRTLSGLALVLGGSEELAAPLLAGLEQRGLKPIHIAVTEAAALRAAIADARSQHGAARAVLHLHGLEVAPVADLAGWRRLYHRDLLSLFHTIQVLIPDLDNAQLIAASRLGGTFGRDAVGEGQPLSGGVCGILNCLRNEYPACRARAVDFDGQTEAEIAGLLVDELLADDSETEAGYIGLERYGAVTLNQPLTPNPFPSQVTPSGDWVLLATGGARGITAEIIEELVRPGMRLVLLGRTAEPAPEDPAIAMLAEAAQLRKAVLAARLARGEKPKPVEIDREVSRLLVDREIRSNLARLRAAGAVVDYIPCDVRDEQALSTLIDSLYSRYGHIDAVIHGAGVIEDKLLADKTAESFERVLSTKLDAAFVLSRKLRPDSLKLLALFTSVAGRYGNRGQTDYAAANEALNRLAWNLHREWTQTRVVAINWGPWDAGMASEGIKQALRERGMEPIPVPSGRRFFLEELAYGPRHDVELVAGAGPWGQLAPPSPVAERHLPGLRPSFPLVRQPPRMGIGGAVTLEHRLTLLDDPYLSDHCILGKPVLPQAVALEYMAQFVAAGWPEWQVAEIRGLRNFAGIMLGKQGRDIVLRARAATHSEPGAQAVTVEIIDPRRGGGVSYRATAVLLQQLPESPLPVLAPLADAVAFDSRRIYSEVLFHGARFRTLAQITGVAVGGVDAQALPSRPHSFLGTGSDGHWLFDPGLLDAGPQLAFLWAQMHRQKGALPHGMGSVQRYGAGVVAGPLRLSQRIRADEAGVTLRYDAEFIDATGRVRLAIHDAESTMSAALNRLSPGSPDYLSTPTPAFVK